MFFGQWVDPDLGQYDDDFVGCVPEEGVGIVYNGDAVDGQYGDTPPISVNEMYSAYSYNVSEEIANNAPGYDVNAKLYDPVQLATDVIVVQNGSLGGTNYNNQNGNLGSAGPGVMDNTEMQTRPLPVTNPQP